MRNSTGGDGFPRVPRRSGVAGLYAVPVLVELAVDPDTGVPNERTARVLRSRKLNASVPLIWRLPSSRAVDDEPNGAFEIETPTADGHRTLPDLDDIATVEEVAAALHVPRRWIIRKARRLPFVIRLSRKKYVCSRTALRRWLASRPSYTKGA
ncbi:MAG: helix-turn-helix domain-containing protein [Candidatus Binataceae bacterium]